MEPYEKINPKHFLFERLWIIVADPNKSKKILGWKPIKNFAAW
jgi:hypothetical protein